MLKKGGVVLLGFLLFFVVSSFSAFAASCGGVTDCSCGDTLNESWTMSSNLSCTDSPILTIGTENITLNCDGNSIVGNSSNQLVSASSMDNVTITGCEFFNASYSLLVDASTNWNLSNNTFLETSYLVLSLSNDSILENNSFQGSHLQLDQALNMTLTDNSFTNRSISIQAGNLNQIEYFIHSVDTTNTLNGKSIYFLTQNTSSILNDTSSIGQIFLVNSSNSVISNLQFTQWEIFLPDEEALDMASAAIITSYTDNVTIENVTIESGEGVMIYNSYNITLANSTFSNSSGGVRVDSSNTSVFTNNTFSNGTKADFQLIDSFDVTVSNNTFSDEGVDVYGPLRLSVTNETYCDNTVTNNSYGGKELLFSNESLTLQHNSNVGQLFLCDADNSLIENVTVQSPGSLFLGKIELVFSDNVNFTTVTSSANEYGFKITNSTGVRIINSTLQGNNESGIYFITSTTGNHWIEGTNITNTEGAAVQVGASGYETSDIGNSTFLSNRFENNSHAVKFYSTEDHLLLNFTTNSFIANRNGGVVDAYNPSTPRNANVTFFGNNLSSNLGIGLHLGTNGSVENNVFENHNNSAISGKDSNYLSNNTFVNNSDGIVLGSSNTLGGNGINASSDDGIVVSGSNVIENNTLFNNSDRGISVAGSNTINNNTILSNEEGIYFTGSSNIISNNTIQNNSLADVSMNLASFGAVACDQTFSSNTLTGNKGLLFYNDTVTISSVTNASEIVLCEATNSRIEHVELSNDGNNYLFIYDSDNVTLVNVTSSNNYHGVFIKRVVNHSIINSSFSNNQDTGIFLSYTSGGDFENLSIQNNSGKGVYSYGPDVDGDDYPRNFTDVRINENTRGVQLDSYGSWQQNFNFTSGTLQNNSVGVEYIHNSIRNIIFQDFVFANNTLDLNLTTGQNITLINTTAEKNISTVDSGTRAFFQRYVFVNVTDPNQNQLENVSVTADDSLGVRVASETTTSSLLQFILTEFYREGDVNYYVTPHTIGATKQNYSIGEESLNLFGKLSATVNFTLQEVTCGSDLNTSILLGSTFSCNDGFNITADNIVINGNQSIIQGNGTGIGLTLIGRGGVTIANVTLVNYSTGVYAQNTNSSLIDSVNISNVTTAIVLNESNNVSITNSYLNATNLTVQGVSSSVKNNSLVNASVSLSSINMTGLMQFYKGWNVIVNATFNLGSALQNANITGIWNSSGLEDDQAVTGSNGLATLALMENLVNNSGSYNLTPHNISVDFASVNSTESNSTIVTVDANKVVNLSLSLDCVAPVSSSDARLYIEENTTFCPGNYSADYIEINTSNVALTCSNTILTGSEVGIVIAADNVTVIGCTFEQYQTAGITIDSYDGFELDGLTFTDVRVTVDTVTSGVINNSHFSAENSDIWQLNIDEGDNLIINNNTFSSGIVGLFLRLSYNNTVTNNSFQDSDIAVYMYFSGTSGETQNQFYYNNFTDTSTYHYYFPSSNSFTNAYNTSVGGYAQGNAYSDYCDKGSDVNSDGYADAVSSSGDDWPYDENSSEKIVSSLIIDYGPLIQDCVSDVFLGSGGGGGSSSSSSGGGSSQVVSSTGGSTKSVLPDEFYTALEAKDNIKEEKFETEKVDAKTTKVTFVLENTGTKKIKLFPTLFDETQEPLFILTRKTLGYKDSFFNRITGLAYSPTRITGRLLSAEIVNPEEIILNPGEKLEQEIEIQEGFTVPRTLTIQFTTEGEVAYEKRVDVLQSIFSGTAVDVDPVMDTMDLYAVVAPESTEEQYFIEVSFQREGSVLFSEWYGPYTIYQEKPLIFGQQLLYDDTRFEGDYQLFMKIFQGNEKVVEDVHHIVLG